MRNTRTVGAGLRLRIGLVAVLTIAAATMLPAVATAQPAASAAVVQSGLSPTLRCGSAGSSLSCQLGNAGTAPYTVRWYRDGRHVPSADDRTLFRSRCTIGSVVDVVANVTDATGASGTASDLVRCGG